MLEYPYIWKLKSYKMFGQRSFVKIVLTTHCWSSKLLGNMRLMIWLNTWQEASSLSRLWTVSLPSTYAQWPRVLPWQTAAGSAPGLCQLDHQWTGQTQTAEASSCQSSGSVCWETLPLWWSHQNPQPAGHKKTNNTWWRFIQNHNTLYSWSMVLYLHPQHVVSTELTADPATTLLHHGCYKNRSDIQKISCWWIIYF